MSIIKSHKGKNLYFVTKSFIKVFDAITPLITLGFYWTDFEYRYTRRQLK